MLPWLATWVLMRRWMDGRLGWGFWGAHGGFLGAGLLLPVIPLLLVMLSQPTMPAEVRRQLAEETKRYRTMSISYQELQELVLRVHDPNSEEPPPASPIAEGQIIRQQLVQDLALDSRAIRYTPTTWPPYLLGEARLARMALEQDADSEPQLVRYRETIDLIDTMVRRLRLSWRLLEQDGADLIEIWLVRELARPDAQQLLGRDLHTRVVRSLGDDAGRHAARRRALVVSWSMYRVDSLSSTRSASEVGGYHWLGESGSILYSASPYSRRRAADYLTWLMLQRLEKQENWDSEPQIRELAKYWSVPEMVYGLGLGGDFLRADDPERFATPVEGLWRRAPGSQWHAGWERLAREMADGLEGQ
jgi:hypothetical protein